MSGTHPVLEPDLILVSDGIFVKIAFGVLDGFEHVLRHCSALLRHSAPTKGKLKCRNTGVGILLPEALDHSEILKKSDFEESYQKLCIMVIRVK